jgi:hypothetical protein
MVYMQTLLTMLKTDLGILSSDAYDERMTQYITSAVTYITNEGAASLDTSKPDDAQLVVMYAAWMWRRRDNMEGMPQMLRRALNNRVFREKAASSDD